MLTTVHSSICNSWHEIRQLAAVAESVYFVCGLKATEFVSP
jgi:hypothetical protein